MTTFERLKFLANKQGKSINRVEQDLNLPKNSLYSWKKAVPSGDRLELIADYFHVSVDYLLGREELEPIKEPVDILEELSVDDVDWDSFMSAGGKPISDRAKASILAAFYDEIQQYKLKHPDD